jgi:hypothetical protein
MVEMETHTEIIGLSKGISMLFIHVPEGYKCTEFSVENNRMEKVGKLNSFNRLKILKTWRKKDVNLVQIFTMALKIKDWDFEKYPNPFAFILVDNEIIEK